jgi:hypothetical protein
MVIGTTKSLATPIGILVATQPNQALRTLEPSVSIRTPMDPEASASV